MNLVHLQSKRLQFRPFNQDDYNALQSILSNPITCEYLPGEHVYTDQQIHKWLQYFINSFSLEKKHVIYAISLKNSDTIIGYCGCNFVPEFEQNEIKYIFHPDYFHQGYASEAALMMKFVAKELGLTSLIGLADISNIASQKVLEKIGYSYIKTIDIWGETMNYYELDLSN